MQRQLIQDHLNWLHTDPHHSNYRRHSTSTLWVYSEYPSYSQIPPTSSSSVLLHRRAPSITRLILHWYRWLGWLLLQSSSIDSPTRRAYCPSKWVTLRRSYSPSRSHEATHTSPRTLPICWGSIPGWMYPLWYGWWCQSYPLFWGRSLRFDSF